jgi:hypothetical protein
MCGAGVEKVCTTEKANESKPRELMHNNLHKFYDLIMHENYHILNKIRLKRYC